MRVRKIATSATGHFKACFHALPLTQDEGALEGYGTPPVLEGAKEPFAKALGILGSGTLVCSEVSF